MQLDSQQSLADIKRGNVTSTPQIFTLVVQHKLSLMKTFVSPGKFTDSCFTFFSLFLFNKILRMSLRRFNFIITSFGKPLEGKRWQSSTKLGSIGTLISFEISKAFDLRSLSARRLAGIPEISVHSLQEYHLLV